MRFTLYGGFISPFSQIIPVIKEESVTSKLGFQPLDSTGEIFTPWISLISVSGLSSIGIWAPESMLISKELSGARPTRRYWFEQHWGTSWSRVL